MKQIVLDCSIVLAWCFPDETGDYAETVLAELQESRGLTPAIWALEMANALLVAERRQRITQADSARFLSLVRSLPIEMDCDTSPGVVDRIMSLARSQGISSYDASYLELAIRHGVPIATLDNKLTAAARSLGVTIQ